MIGRNQGENNPMFGRMHTDSTKLKIAESRNAYKLEKHPLWKGGRRISSNGYIEIRSSEHNRSRANGYVFEHILVAEEKLGREISIKENVHHINGNKLDNRPGNLEVLTLAEHTRKHSLEKRKGVYKDCMVCGSEFYRKKSQAEKAKTCSKECAGKLTNLKRKGEFK